MCLHAIQEVLNDPQIKYKEAKDVRWLSHANAVVRTLPSLLTSLEREAAERGDPTANGLLRHTSLLLVHFYLQIFSLISTDSR